MSHIVTLISEAIELDLSEACEQLDDDTSVELVQHGRLQDDPEALRISVQILPNDQEDPRGWVHERFRPPTIRSPDNINVLEGVFEIGGGEFWVRRFTITIKMYLMRDQVELEEALDIMHTVLGRCEYTLRESSRISGLEDDWGEQVINISKHGVRKSEMLLKGGPPSDWIGEGKIWYEAYTQRP